MDKQSFFTRGRRFAINRIVASLTLTGVLLALGASAQERAVVTQPPVLATQERRHVSGEEAAQALKERVEAEAQTYNIRYGPIGIRVGAAVGVGYTDNAFYSETNRQDDIVINPQVNFDSFMQVSELNALRLTVGVGYEYFTDNTELNPDAPLVNPNSELTFNIFAGDFHIELHDRFSYQETLFINTTPSGQDLLFNFNNVSGTFSRWDNFAGLIVDWDLDRVLLTVGYDHENFESTTSDFEYLNRASELWGAAASLWLGDHAKTGIEGRGGFHNYENEGTLNDNWQARVGPFVEAALLEGLRFRAGGGYDTAQYDSAGSDSDYKRYYAYGLISQEVRFFTHSLSAGNENRPGDNANNLRNTYIRYAITAPLFEHVDVGASGAIHWNREWGGAGGFDEDYTYGVIGVRAGYQLHRYWRTDVGYEFLTKDSDLPDRDYYRNRATVSLTFAF